MSFHEAISRMLEAKLKNVIASEKQLNLLTCTKIYSEIFDTLVECFTAANVNVGNETMNYVAQQYYDGILVNDNQELDPNIFTERAKLSNIETKELALLAVMLRGTDFAFPVLEEIKKRS